MDAGVIRVAGREVTRDRRFGQGFVVALSRGGDGSLWLIHMMNADPSGTTMRSVTLRSSDGGATWQEVAAIPPSLIGIAIDDDGTGYAWAESTVYRTTDDGKTWRPKPIPSAHLHRANASSTPRLGPGGYLWAPSEETDSTKLIRIGPDLGQREIAAWDSERITGVVPLSNAQALVVLNGRRTTSRVVRVSVGDKQVSVTDAGWHATGTSVGQVYARGGNVILRCIGEKAPAGFLQPWPTYLVISRDRGTTWERQDNTGDASSLCLSDEGAWALSQRDHTAWLKRL
jgi:hypothetical protein